ncbi:hypothetical protein SISNIDRAFT_395212, partial [Sistotremastrum niveocremeum HHB9708]
AASKNEKGFYRMFVAWLVSENMPFTAGEAPTLRSLFKWLEVHYDLPSGTTARNQLARLYADLLRMNLDSKIAYQHDSWTTRGMIHSFAGSIADWIDEEWNLKELCVDMHLLEDDEHKG